MAKYEQTFSPNVWNLRLQDSLGLFLGILESGHNLGFQMFTIDIHNVSPYFGSDSPTSAGARRASQKVRVPGDSY